MRTFGMWLAGLALAAAAPAQELTEKAVNDAIDRGLHYLYAKQLAKGDWGDGGIGVCRGGGSALATLAILSCEVPPDDPRVQSALGFLRTLPPEHTYVVALQAMALANGDPVKDMNLIRRNAEWLVRARNGNGMWSYGDRGGGDPSNTQYALLGLDAAVECGAARVDPGFWKGCRFYWENVQAPVGSWGYHAGQASGSMTTAGLSSLVIASRHLPTTRAGEIEGQRVRCAGPIKDPHLERGIAWLERNFSVRSNPGTGQWLAYYLYGLERAGRLTSRRFFGAHDWYREGAALLLKKQNADGAWRNMGGGLGVADEALVDTCLCLLFLSKGRLPILVNKLKHGRGEDWNNAPRDVHQLTGFVAKLWSRKLNWQTVELDRVTVEDLLQAPILQFSGHLPPNFDDRQVKLLRGFVEQGGYLVADANCSTRGFEQGFRAVCKKMFPDPEQQLRPLEPGHAVWSSMFELKPTWPLEGINVGCRTAVFFSPEDLSCAWHHSAAPDDLPALRMGANIVAYATGPDLLKGKLDERKIYADAGEDKIRRNFLQIAKIRHGGDWNLAPRAVRNLMQALREQAKIDVVGQQRDMPLLDPNLTNYPLAYMHGRTRFKLGEEERKALADYLKGNGTLLADACCASPAFDTGFREMLKEALPEHPLQPIPFDHELFTAKVGYDLRTVQANAALKGVEGPPALEGVLIDGRYAVIYSKYDLGCALENQSAKDCKGYTHESAVKIAANAVLYALKN